MTDHGHASTTTAPSLPLAVQVGFSGLRLLRPVDSPLQPEAFEQAVAAELLRELQALPGALKLSSQHFMVGISQMAIGADMLFTQAVRTLGWCQRVFLPQSRDEYLQASGSGGDDFSPEERSRAAALMDAPHVIEERVVSTARARADRFDDANLALVAEADVVICLRHEGLAGRPGGAAQMAERAKARGVPLLELLLSIGPDGTPVLTPHWFPQAASLRIAGSLPPVLQCDPAAIKLDRLRWPEPSEYANALKELASARAGQRRSGFRWAAGVIVGTHVAATLIATAVLGHVIEGVGAKLALGAEVFFLIGGLYTHRALHASHHTQDWAMARLCAEVGRSVRAVGKVMRSLDHLFQLPMPASLRHVVRTLNVLQLRHTRQQDPQAWREELKGYLDTRLLAADPRKGQLAYYEVEAGRARRWAWWAGHAFTVVSLMAILATLLKLGLKFIGADDDYGIFLGLAAVVLPVAAVGAMSITAALDTEARAHEFNQMKDFLQVQAKYLQQAGSGREAAALAAETELRLLGETVAWYSRRAYTGIA